MKCGPQTVVPSLAARQAAAVRDLTHHPGLDSLHACMAAAARIVAMAAWHFRDGTAQDDQKHSTTGSYLIPVARPPSPLLTHGFLALYASYPC